MRDLAPTIYRQRLIIEGCPDYPIDDSEIKEYLTGLSSVIDMHPLIEPVTHRSDKFGWAGWIHWETSGAHFYAWEKPILFFSVDIYTCKQFDPEDAVAFTKKFFNVHDVEQRSF
jgi:S-adenosylmethionine decarboxylase